MGEGNTMTDVKDLRVEIDRVIKIAQVISQEIDRGNGGREIALAVTKLQEAKMWAGKTLESLDYKLPEEYRDEFKVEQPEETA